MPNLTVDEMVSNKHKRNFIQFGGASPANKVQFAGQDTQYVSIDGVSVDDNGAVNPVWVHDPSFSGRFKLIGRTVSPPNLAKASVKMREKHGAIPRTLLKQNCKFNLYELTGTCGDLSDFVGGWSDYVLIYSNAITTTRSLGTRSAWDKDDAIEDDLSIVLSDVYPVGSLSFGEGASTQIDREVVDVVYGAIYGCIDCDDGTQRIYSLTKSSGAGSPGLPAEIQYTNDGGATWNQANITGMGATEDPLALDIVGANLVAIGASAIYYAAIDQNTGVPGTFTKVTAGFVTTLSDMYVAGSREVYFVGASGYIYKTSDVTNGVTVLNAGVATSNNLVRIHGCPTALYAVGAAGTIIKSLNGGATWVTTDSTPTGQQIQAVSVIDANVVWIGTATGNIYYTLNGGATWTEFLFPNSGTGSIYDINFATPEVGYFSHSTTTPTARLYTTWNGGADWTKTKNRVMNMPTFQKIGRIATPKSLDAGVNANNVTIGGISGGGVDGILLIGVASKK
jgi:photosystem II stability/assembly factor-like uncharacterized protein